VCSGEDSGEEDATLLKPPTVDPEKWTRRGGKTSAVARVLPPAGDPVGVIVSVGESDFGAGELAGGIDAWEEAGVAVYAEGDGCLPGTLEYPDLGEVCLDDDWEDGVESV
jgi:hypothetical protein